MPQSDTLDILERLIAFDTVSSRSNIALIEFIEQYLAKLNLTGIRSGSEPEHKANLIVTIGPPDIPGIILSGHTDVVPVEGQAWTSPPFTATRLEHRIYGRGTADMKGFLACILAAAPRMCQAKLKRPIYLAFSYDEEVGCLGIRHLLPWLRDLPQRPIACIVGEPTNMEVIVAHKSSRSFRVTVTGLEGHSSRAPESVNAVEYAARLIVLYRISGVAWLHLGCAMNYSISPLLPPIPAYVRAGYRSISSRYLARSCSNFAPCLTRMSMR